MPDDTQPKKAPPGSPALAGSGTTDTQRLEWVIDRKATCDRRFKMKTRRGGLAAENLEPVWCLEWEQPNGDLIMQSPDNDHKTLRDAIDAGMGLSPNSSSTEKIP